jgi:hypothetical protein
MAEPLKKAFQDLSQALQSLHRSLLMLQANQLNEGEPVNPYDLLQATLHDPAFAWLRKMSALIVHVDTIIDETPTLGGVEANQVHDQVLRLIEKPDPKLDQDFWNHYSAHLANNPEIIMKHSNVKTILERLRPTI